MIAARVFLARIAATQKQPRARCLCLRGGFPGTGAKILKPTWHLALDPPPLLASGMFFTIFLPIYYIKKNSLFDLASRSRRPL